VSYLVLARKYRPQTFEDLVGQDHVARTLANAIATGRVAHAFLFTGVRGVGKTTSARLLAKCLNCVGADGKLTGATATPCNVCGPCREITSGQDLDVQEIDGASYNGVDEVRRLQEGMTFRPARDRFKIYIVDEVHMLSTAAWNAFLKTLEEPPPHVKFIFATTEAHKVPVTILSRCQRYDFKLIPTQTIAHRLEQVLAREAIEADAAAVQVLAREAAGSMRDAMSVLDQVIAFSGTKITGDDVTRVLGVADRNVLHELATALVTGDAAACIGVVDRLAQQGFDLTHVAKDVLRHLRNLVVAKVCSGTAAQAAALGELLDLADEETRDVVDLAARAEADDLSRLFQAFSRAFDEIVRSGQPRMGLEMALVRLARRPPLLPLDELLARVGELERRLASGAPPPSPAPRGGGGGSSGPRHASSGLAPSASVPSSTSEPTTRTHGALALVEPPPTRALSKAATLIALAPPPPPVASPPVATEGVAPPDLEAWRDIVERVRAERPPLASLFEHAAPTAVGPTGVVVRFDAQAAFLHARALEFDALEVLRRAVRAHFGASVSVAIDSGSPASSGAPASPGAKTLASLEAERRSAEQSQARAAVEAHPVVRQAIALFEAQLRDIRLPDDRS
jgi:DNA polymerase-3 subunit gamma/tau